MAEDQRRLLFSDVDDTLTGDEVALQQLMAALAEAAGRVIVAYNSSRPCASLRRTLAELPLLRLPDYLVGALGTEIEAGRSGEPLAEFGRQFLRQGWERERVHALALELGFRLHPDEFQTPFKASYDVPGREAVEQVQRELEARKIAARIIYSGGHNLDFIPLSAGKQAPIDYLRQLLGVRPERVVVAGDSGNDVDMFVPPYRGIIVGNADPDLRELQGEGFYHAQARHAGGVLEGLRYWGVV